MSHYYLHNLRKMKVEEEAHFKGEKQFKSSKLTILINTLHI